MLGKQWAHILSTSQLLRGQYLIGSILNRFKQIHPYKALIGTVYTYMVFKAPLFHAYVCFFDTVF